MKKETTAKYVAKQILRSHDRDILVDTIIRHEINLTELLNEIHKMYVKTKATLTECAEISQRLSDMDIRYHRDIEWDTDNDEIEFMITMMRLPR